ncbi:MAG: dihydrolipoamide acetyltransferase family protein [Gaiellaceae bacterium]|jgi:pyruvate dehydrogenase E2 component (dihydrolipoamide acetyltransferase)
MATEIKLPRLGQGMESGTIVKWLKSEGESVEKGEPLYELDTDKVTQEVEADASGVLLKIAVEEGEVEVGKTIAVIGKQGEDVSISGNGAKAPEAAKPKQAPIADTSEGQSPTPVPSRDGGRIKASPLARRIARERGIDLAQIQGTGPEGRIVAEDVERAEAAPTPALAEGLSPGQVETRQLTSVRKTIARRLTQAWEAPVFQLVVSADMTQALALVERLRELHPDERPTVTDVLTRVTAAALMRHRDVNAHYVDGAVQIHPTANVGIAVAAPQGLVVPVIRNADRLSTAEIARARADLVQRTRDNKLKQEDVANGTFTISNLGMFGVEQFVAVLNPPQVAILAVGASEQRVVVRNGDFTAVPLMTMTLTCDHRAIDGAVGADFLRTLKQLVESPALAL